MNSTKDQLILSNLILASNHSKASLFLGINLHSEQASGLVKLPVGIRNSPDFKTCGAAFRQYLDRQPCWKSLVTATPHLIPYSLRHGYALRGVKYYENSMPMRDLAALMGHDLRTHHKHYGVWTDEAGLQESALRVVGDLMKLQS